MPFIYDLAGYECHRPSGTSGITFANFFGMKRLPTKHGMRGFSLTEILIVTSVTLCIAATAIPKVANTVSNMELRAALRSASGVIQQTRSLSIKKDAAYKVRYVNGTSGGTVYADLNNNHVVDRTEPQAQMGTTVMAYYAPTGIPTLDSSLLGFDPDTATSVSFNSTGQPCVGHTSCAVGVVIYFTDTRVVGAPGWGAVSISPAGRVSNWLWTGTNWAN